jgi:hypothetical protein
MNSWLADLLVIQGHLFSDMLRRQLRSHRDVTTHGCLVFSVSLLDAKGAKQMGIDGAVAIVIAVSHSMAR